MAETKVYSIQINGVDKAVNSIDELEAGVKSLEAKLKGEKIGTESFKRLQNEVKKAKSQLKDFELQVEGLDKEQRAGALVDSFNGLTGAVGAVSSAFLAFGVESEAIEGAERKLLGVIGVVSGLRDASNGLIAVQKLMGNTSIKMGDYLTKAFAGGIKGANGLKVALASTGIGLLIVAVGLLITYWDEFVALVSVGTNEMKKYDDALLDAEAATAGLAYETNYYNGIVQDTSKSESEREVALKELNKRGIATEDITLSNAEALDELNKRVTDNIKLIVAKSKAEAASKLLSEALEQQLKKQGSTLEDNISFWEKTGNAILSSFSPGLNAGILNATTAVKNQAKSVKESTDEVTRATGVYQKALEELIPLEATNADTQKLVKERLERRAQSEKGLETAIANRAKAEEEALAIATATAKELQILRAKGVEKEVIAINQAYEDRIANQTKAYGAESQQVKNLLELRDAEIKAARDAYQDEATADYLTLINEIDDAISVETEAKRMLEIQRTNTYYNDLIEEAKKYGLSITELEIAKQQALDKINKEGEEKRLADQKQASNDALQLVSDSIGVIAALNDAYAGSSEEDQKKAFEVAKKAQIAQAVISTILGAQNAFATAAASPLTALFPAYPFIQAGLATAFGLASIKKIGATQFSSTTAAGTGGSPSSGGSGGNGGTSSSSLGAPRMNDSSNSNQNQQNTNSNNVPVVKTYVLAGDVSTAQDANEKINQRRKL